jgi:hypothetical protein
VASKCTALQLFIKQAAWVHGAVLPSAPFKGFGTGCSRMQCTLAFSNSGGRRACSCSLIIHASACLCIGHISAIFRVLLHADCSHEVGSGCSAVGGRPMDAGAPAAALLKRDCLHRHVEDLQRGISKAAGQAVLCPVDGCRPLEGHKGAMGVWVNTQDDHLRACNISNAQAKPWQVVDNSSTRSECVPHWLVRRHVQWHGSRRPPR